MSFTAWRTQNQEFVTVSPPSAVGHVRGDVQMHLQKIHPQPRECYQNAQKVCAAVPSVNYVLGRVTIPGYGTIDHAWNSDEHGHFDVTLGGRGDFSQCVFQAIVTLTADQVNAMTWMGMPPTIYEVFQTLQSAAA